MPVRSLNSPVIRWPDRRQVEEALARWARATAQRVPLRAVGFFGSYARGDWGVGSDVDVAVIVTDTELPFERRGAAFDTSSLPVPAQLLVYTVDEWASIVEGDDRFAQVLRHDTVWVYQRGAEPSL